jgi:cytidine deaminase
VRGRVRKHLRPDPSSCQNRAMDLVSDARVERLRTAAEVAADACYPRYSGFGVTAAVERVDGKVYGGANIEIVNYTLTKHAEEAAALAAIADGALALGDRWLTAVYTRGAPPCGSCRQFLWEWAVPEEAVCVIDLRSPDTRIRQSLLADLYPEPFDPSALPDRRPPARRQ